ncbi:MAG TPA: FAD binding domain-containing protein [Candidatus Limnocylindrales bacterium]
MIPARFDYVRPASLDEVLAILRDREGEAKVLAGGYSLLPLMKLRLAQPALVVDIGAIEGLDGIARTDDWWRIGARATHRSILLDDALAADHPIIRDAAKGIGDPQVRNWGTIGGSCAHADPSSDWPAVLQALDASFVCRSAAAERVVPARGFFIDAFQTGIEPAEVLTEVRIPVAAPGSGSAYVKLERRAGDFATVGAAASIQLGADGRIAKAGVALTAVGDAAFTAADAEAALVGAVPGEEAFAAAGAAAAARATPVADGHGPADYKRAMAREIVIRALRLAAERATAA